MHNFLDLLATKNICLAVHLELHPIIHNGVPDLSISINNINHYQKPVSEVVTIDATVPLLDPLSVTLTMSGKKYCKTAETAVIVKSLMIDQIELTNFYDQCVPCITYQNDQNVDYQGFYLGFNGTWCFELDQPFYRWLHTATGQGWLLEPVPVKQI
jgi:hypothetical protein